MRKIYHRKRQEDLENRIIISSQRYFSNLKILYLVLGVIIISGIAALIYYKGIEFYTLGISAGAFLFSIILIRYLQKHSYVISIKDDSIIHTRSDDRSFITSVKAISNLRSFNLLGLVFTHYTFNLDGVYRNSLVVTKWSGKEKTPKFILSNVIRTYKKEKANHKPGSVIAV